MYAAMDMLILVTLHLRPNNKKGLSHKLLLKKLSAMLFFFFFFSFFIFFNMSNVKRGNFGGFAANLLKFFLATKK